jgi:hypothetical protein
MMRASLVVFAAAVSIAAAGCNRAPDVAKSDAEKQTPMVSEREMPGTEAQSDVSAPTAMARVGDLELGSAVAPDGGIAEGAKRDDFAPGEPVYLSVAVEDIGAGSAVKAVWKGKDDVRLHEEVKTVPAGASHLTFEAPSTASWTPGNFEVEIFLGDEEGGSESFEIKAKAATPS